GMIAVQTPARNGSVVGAVLVDPSDEIMLITTSGVLVRTRVAEIREMGRATQGVTLINVDEDSHLSGVRRVVESDADNEDESDQASAHASSGEQNDHEASVEGDSVAGNDATGADGSVDERDEDSS